MFLMGWIAILMHLGMPALLVGAFIAWIRVPPHIAFILLIALAAIAAYAYSARSLPNAGVNVWWHIENTGLLFFLPLLFPLFVGFVVGFKIRNAS